MGVVPNYEELIIYSFVSDHSANNICTAGSLPFQRNHFNLLRAGRFRGDGHPWPKRSIFWL